MRTHRQLFCGHGIGVARECVVRMNQLTLTSQPCHKPPCSIDPTRTGVCKQLGRDPIVSDLFMAGHALWKD